MCAIKLALLYMSKMTVEKIINMETWWFIHVWQANWQIEATCQYLIVKSFNIVLLLYFFLAVILYWNSKIIKY
jgi:hypothetical protein